MWHELPLPPGPRVAVERVPTTPCRGCASPGTGRTSPARILPRTTPRRARSLRRHVQVFAVREGMAPVTFAQLERDGAAAEITQVYVDAEHRGAGLGTAI